MYTTLYIVPLARSFPTEGGSGGLTVGSFQWNQHLIDHSFGQPLLWQPQLLRRKQITMSVYQTLIHRDEDAAIYMNRTTNYLRVHIT